jgi:5-methylcytosine-specific restriction enzyme B
MTKDELMKKTSLSEDDVDEIEDLLNQKRQIIFYGPPGTGKTFIAEQFATYFSGSKSAVEIVQFHPSYSYEDFVEGIRPNLSDNGNANGFSKKPGILLKMTEECAKNPGQKYVLIIDEINRGHISKIFGELIYLLEYRTKDIRLTYSPDSRFSLPDKLYIIGTMNSTDTSIAFVDHALRRRFFFKEFPPNYGVLQSHLEQYSPDLADGVVNMLKNTNEKIKTMLGNDYQIGHSYFMVEGGLTSTKIERILKYAIKPLVNQYFFGNSEKVQEIEKVLRWTEENAVVSTDNEG